MAGQWSREDLLRAFDLLTKAEQEVRVSDQPRYNLEMALLRLMHLRKLVPLSDLALAERVEASQCSQTFHRFQMFQRLQRSKGAAFQDGSERSRNHRTVRTANPVKNRCLWNSWNLWNPWHRCRRRRFKENVSERDQSPASRRSTTWWWLRLFESTRAPSGIVVHVPAEPEERQEPVRRAEGVAAVDRRESCRQARAGRRSSSPMPAPQPAPAPASGVAGRERARREVLARR